MAKTKSNGGLTYKPIGNASGRMHGVMMAHDKANKRLLFEIDMSPKAIKAAPISSTGKNKLAGSTAGFAKIPGTPYKINVCALAPATAAEQAEAADDE